MQLLNSASHLERSLRQDIELIRSKVDEMATLGEEALKCSLRALAERNRQLAYSVILRDQYIDEMENELDRLCLEFLVRQQPVATHLRFVYTAIKMNKELERIGDYAESVARQVLVLGSLDSVAFHPAFSELGALAVHMTHDAVQAFLNQDADLARRTMEIEERANLLRDRISRDLGNQEREGNLHADALLPLLTIARRFERVTDQAKNICEEVLYLCTGEFIKHKGNEAFRVLFVDATNSCLSQIAEAIGNSLAVPRFVFSSAGVAPQPLDPRTMTFLGQKGIDTSRQAAKAIGQIPHLEHYHVIVALSPEAREILPSPPTKTVCLIWQVCDPAAVRGEDTQIQSAFEQAFDSLSTQIRDLVAAVLGNDGKSERPK